MTWLSPRGKPPGCLLEDHALSLAGRAPVASAVLGVRCANSRIMQAQSDLCLNLIARRGGVMRPHGADPAGASAPLGKTPMNRPCRFTRVAYGVDNEARAAGGISA